MIPDLVIGGRPVSRAELDEAPALRPADYLVVPQAPGAGRDLLAERDRFTADLISHGMAPSEAASRARRAAETYDRTSRRR